MGRLKLWLQYLLPHHLLTALVGAAVRWRFKPWKRLLIGAFCRVYRPNLSEARASDANDYEYFNAFFTRALKPGTRPIPADPSLVVSPADGVLSQCGQLDGERLIQAKGIDYTATALLGHSDWAAHFAGGAFITLYLSPAHYHRVHMPLDASLTATQYLPGRLFSVAPFTVQGIPDLFCRNERLVCLFDTPAGLMAQVLVGAMLVAGIETAWHGAYGHPQESTMQTYPTDPVELARGEEMGRFNLGSTVILLFQPGRVQLRNDLTAGNELHVGEPIGQLQ